MRLRWKILALMLVVGLVPLALSTVIGQQAARNVGDILSRASRDTLRQLLVEELREDAVQQTTLIAAEIKSLEFMVRTLARETGVVLALDIPPEEAPLHGSADFDAATPPPGTRLDTRFLDLRAPVRPRPLSVSRQEPVFLPPPGATLDDPAIRDQAGRLRRMLPLLASLAGDYNKPIYRLFLTTTAGLTMLYPGHGNFPAGHDPRTQRWWERAMEANAPAWTAPVLDPATGQPTFTLAVPIHLPSLNGSQGVAGLAGLDLLVTEALPTPDRTRPWSQPSQTCFVSREDADTLQVIGPDLAGLASQQGQAGQERGAAMSILKPQGDTALETMLADLDRNRSGSVERDWLGHPAVLAYAPIDDRSFLLFTLAKDIMEELPRRASEEVLGLIELQTLATGAVALGMVILFFLLAMRISRRLTAPMTAMVDMAARLSRGEFAARIPLKTRDERDVLIQALNDMGPRLEDLVRVRHALAVAEEVQQNLLPRSRLDLPGFDLAGRIRYCDETGGDYYDFFLMPGPLDAEGREGGQVAAVAVGDVTGHGVPSALLMATARALLRGLSALPLDPSGAPGPVSGLGDRVSLVNRLLCADVQGTGRFMTLFFLELDAVRKRARWVRAGHDPALLLHPDGTVETLMGDGLLLGVDDDFRYTESERVLDQPGTVLVLGTDGIWEAVNEAGEMYGKERLLQSVLAHRQEPAQAILDAVFADLLAFCPSPQDDATLAVIKTR